MFCSKCGSKNDGDAAFCTKCGTKMNVTQPINNNLKSYATQPTNNKVKSYATQPTNNNVKSYLVGSILQTVVCIPAGIVPLIYACQVNSKLAQGDIVGAQEASQKAKFWLNLTTIIFGAIIILIIVLNAIGNNYK